MSSCNDKFSGLHAQRRPDGPKVEKHPLRSGLRPIVDRDKPISRIPSHPIAIQPSYSWPEAGNLTVRYEYDFMPKSLVTRLMVALNHRIADQNHVWKSGAIFQRDETRAEVIEDYPKRRISVRANRPDARGLVAIIDDHLG